MARTGVLLKILHDVVGADAGVVRCAQSFVDVRTVSFEARRDVDRLVESAAIAGPRRSSVYEDRWSIVASKGHDDTRQVLVAARNSNAGVVALGTGHGFNAVRYDLA